MKKTLSYLLVIIVLGFSVYWFTKPNHNQTNSGDTITNPDTNQPQTQTPDQSVLIEIDYKKDGSFEPKTNRVKEGQTVMIKVTSDLADELHIHGYDLAVDLEAGKLGELNFVADKTGRFEFELEGSKITLGVIEVYPK